MSILHITFMFNGYATVVSWVIVNTDMLVYHLDLAWCLYDIVYNHILHYI